MEAFICRRCGVQYAPSDGPPAGCPICEDERECVAWGGQQWTTMSELIGEGRQNHVQAEEPGLYCWKRTKVGAFLDKLPWSRPPGNNDSSTPRELWKR